MINPISKFAPFLVGEYPKSFMELVNNITHHEQMTEEDLKINLWKAYEFGVRKHDGQKRKSGGSYFHSHCLEVAKILASWNMDHITIIGGMLHDTIEDTDTTLDEIEQEFGKDVASLVNGVSKLGGISFSSRKAKQAGNFMKMLISVAKDLRVIIIKFADRLHNMSTIKHLSRIKQHRIAIETRDVYVPLAHRLGMAQVKWKLDDLILKTLNPKAYKDIDVKLKSSNKERIKHINLITKSLQDELSNYNIKPLLYGRPKSRSSIYGKMVERGKPFEEIYDVLAVRLIVDKVEECYLALGVLHQIYKPIQDRFKDFIAMPKSNGYQSIHSTVIGPKGKMVEIQIRTKDMEQTAEIGIAAHWRYKSDNVHSESIDGHVKWLRDLLEILQSEENDPKEFMHLLKIDLFNDEIFVFTPKGDLIQLPVRSTPIDFAYHVHTEVGHTCLGAKINYKTVPLNTALKNGDTIEILSSDSQSPNYSWLKFAVTSKARSQIRRFLNKKEREESVKIGNEILNKGLRRLKILNQLDKIKSSYSRFGFGGEIQLIEAIGKGEISIRNILDKISPNNEDIKKDDPPRFLSFKRTENKNIKLEGISNIMANFGKCCNPIPGDNMVGFITRGRGMTVHRVDCKSLPLIDEESDRIVPVDWEVGKKDLFNVRMKVVGQDRKGLVKDMTETIAKLNVNMTSVDIKVKDTVATAILIIQVKNLKEFDRIVRNVSKVNSIDSVERAKH